MTSTLHANIIGAGISGLTTGIALKRLGYNVKIFDKVKKLETRGMGLTLQPYAFESLKRISPNLGEKVLHMSQRTGDINVFSANNGSKLATLSDKFIETEFKYPIATVPRTEFYNLLVEEMKDHIHLGKFFKEYYEDVGRNEITAAFIDGSREKSDILIGADGHLSNVSPQTPCMYRLLCLMIIKY